MATVYSDPITTSVLPDTIRAIYSEELSLTATPKLIFDQFTESKDDFRAKKGERVYWTIFRHLPPAINPLLENVDVDGGQMSDFQVSFTVNEYGYAIGTTEKLDLLSYFGPISNLVRQVLGPQMALTTDLLARNAFYGTGARYRFFGGSASARSGLTAGNGITEQIIRMMGHNLSIRRVPFAGNGYVATIHPSVTYDVMSLPGWVNAQLYAGSTRIFNGEVGMLHGVRFVEAETARLPNAGAAIAATTLTSPASVGDAAIHVAAITGLAAGQEIALFPQALANCSGTDAGEENVVIDSVEPDGTVHLRTKLMLAHANGDKVKEGVDIYPLLGQGSLKAVGKGVVQAPEVRVALPTDKLRRMNFVGWYGLMGYGVIRDWAYDLWELTSSVDSAPAFPW
jgi:N4-gp56 family major capsid protein